jgi:hypothetical protein
MKNPEEYRKYFFLPVNTGYVDGELPDNRCIAFYSQRSAHGLYCAIVGNVLTPNGFGTNTVCARISTSGRWQALADAIKDKGAYAGMQLSSTWPGYEGMRSFLSRDVEAASHAYKTLAAQFSVAQILDFLDDLDRGAELAVKAGFTHIQVHAAHGYLFSLLIDEVFCRHSDLVLARVGAWAVALKGVAETSLRFSAMTGSKDIDGSRRGAFTAKLFELPFSYFDVTAGFYNINKQLIYPSTTDVLVDRKALVNRLALDFPKCQIILSDKGRSAWDSSLSNNIHIGLCRDLIANPDFLRDRSEGCSTCMKCHYFSRGDKDLTCGRWA